MKSLLFLITLLASTNYSGNFEEGDWVSYVNFRYVTSAATDQTVVYFGTTGGVIRYDKFAGEWLQPLTVTDGIPNARIDNIAYDPQWDRIWVSTPSGAAYYDPTLERWYTDDEFPVELARNDYPKYNFEILNTQFGYFYQDGYLIDQYSRRYQLTAGIEDDFDNLYVGTWGRGPVLIDTRFKDLKLLGYGPYSDNISAVVRVGDDFWLGDGSVSISSGALTLFDTKSGEWQWFEPRYTDGLASADLIKGWGDKKEVWLATDYGLTRFKKSNGSFETFADNSSLPSVQILSVAAGRDYVFTGTANGLGYINKSADKKKDHESENDNEDSLAERQLLDRERFVGWHINDLKVIGDYLYMASDKGALRKKLDDNSKFVFLQTEDSKLATEILEISNRGDSLYFLTDNDIVIVNTKTEESSIVTDYSYYPEWRLRDMAADGRNIWAATDIGLWKYRISDGYRRLFTAGDGMISDDIRGMILDGDYLWLATPRGLIRFFWNDPNRGD
jgi:ligand-binding sensor domain-containing protein